jgi:hypothetical protein
MERATRLFPSIVLADLSDAPLSLMHSSRRHTDLNSPPVSGSSVLVMPVSNLALKQAQTLATTLATWANSGHFVLVRLNGSVREPTISMARLLGPVVFLASIASAPRSEWRRQGETLRRTLPGSQSLLVFP